MAGMDRQNSTSTTSSYLSDQSRNSRAYLTPANEYLYAHLENGPPARPSSCGACGCHGGRIRTVLVIVSFVTSLLAFGFSGFLVAKTVLRDESQASVTSCVPCKSIQMTSSPDDDPEMKVLSRRFTGGEEICCASTPKQFVALIKKIFDRKYEKTKAAEQKLLAASTTDDEYADKEPIATHLVLSSGDNGARWLNMKLSSQSSMSYQSGIHSINNRLLIEHGGLYYVYCQLAFKIVLGSTDTPPHHLQTTVKRYNVKLPNNGVQTLLKASHTVISPTSANIYLHTSYVGGMFLLNARDEIFVDVLNRHFVDREENLSFIGVFKLER